MLNFINRIPKSTTKVFKLPMKKIHYLLLLICLSLSLPGIGFSQDKDIKIGIALSGGGAKGIAHVGVLKVLEEAGIYPDIITGTSMGSVVGGLYAIGYSVVELDSLVRTLEWSAYFTDTYDRSYRTIEEKEEEERYIFSFPFEDKKVKLPKGFVDGQKLSILLSNLTLSVHGIDSFDDYPIPFRCIGTDLVTGEAIVFDHGFLPDAIRGSISIPSVFEPQEVNGRLVVDGGLSRNLPVQDAFDMGADIVIAVDVGAVLYKREELSSILTVLDQTSSFQIDKSNQQQINLASVVIRPDITPFSALDFTPLDSIIHAGEVAARQILPEILKIVHPDKNTPIIKKGINHIMPEEILISDIEVVGLDSSTLVTFLNILQLKTQKKYEPHKIDDKIARVLATELFNKLNYQLIPEEDSFRLKISANKTDNTSIKLGLNYHSTFNAGFLFNVTVQNLILKGSKFSVDVRISENPALRANYLVYTKTRPNIGFRFSGIANFYPGFLYLNSSLIDEYNFIWANSRLDIFSGLGRNTSVGIGISAEYQRLDKRFFALETGNPSLEQIVGHFNFKYDCFNRKYFPTRGAQLRLAGNLVLDGKLLNSAYDMSNFSTFKNTYNVLSYRQLFSLRSRLVLEWYNWAGISKFNDTDYMQLFYLGRSLPYSERYIPFSGFNYMERPVGSFVFSGLKLQHEIYKNIFAVLSFNHGFFKAPDFTYIDDNGYNLSVAEEKYMSGVGLEIGALSNFGPVSITSEYNFETQKLNFLFQMGFSF
jgi:NTE family protein